MKKKNNKKLTISMKLDSFHGNFIARRGRMTGGGVSVPRKVRFFIPVESLYPMREHLWQFLLCSSQQRKPRQKWRGREGK
jgi:hypothetical protein